MTQFEVSLDKINDDTWQVTLQNDNESTGFYIVGQYDSEEAAERAFSKMWEMNLAHCD